jgi:S-formylglutathione hydrolase FrmB
MRRAPAAFLCALALALALALPAGAGASERVTFELPSSAVDTATPGGTLTGARATPTVNVLLPHGYDEREDRRYPVLWLLHGAQSGTESWFGAQDVEAAAEGFPGIIVMPDGGRWGMYMDWWNGGARGGPAWASYHLELLRSEIERRFPIRAGRRWHAIGGISMGGQGALRYAAMLPGYFGSVAGLSAAFPDIQAAEAQVGISLLPAAGGAPGVSYDAIFGPGFGPYAAGNSPEALAPNYEHTRVFLSSGNGSNCPQDPVTGGLVLDAITESFIHAQQAPFAAAARAAGAEVTERSTCGVHTFGVFDRALADAISNWGFFEPVGEDPLAWTHRTIAQSGEMWGIRYRFDSPPGAVAELARDGDRLTGTGAGSLTLGGPAGCRIAVSLPFAIDLSRACPPAPAAEAPRAGCGKAKAKKKKAIKKKKRRKGKKRGKRC